MFLSNLVLGLKKTLTLESILVALKCVRMSRCEAMSAHSV